MTLRLAPAIIVAALVAACSSAAGSSPFASARASAPPSAAPESSSPEPSAEPVELTVFAAASLRAALEDANAAYEADNPGSTVTISTDSSAALATQVQEGAPADVFLSADTTTPQQLVEGGFADGEAVEFARNELTIITPADNPGGLAGPFDLARDGIRVVAAGDEVPITKYASLLVKNLAAADGAPAGFAAMYAANVVSKEDNVAAVRTKVELGEGDAAIVYVTDAKASDQVAAVDVPDDVNVPATYAGVVVKASPNADAAHEFLEWFAGPGGQAILAEYGFLPPPP